MSKHWDLTGRADRRIAAAVAGALLWTGLSTAAWAQTPPSDDVTAPGVSAPAGVATDMGEAAAEDKISATLGYDFASHFVSYGADVWGGGDDIYGSELTNFVWGTFSVDLSPVTLTFGAWSDINDNVVSGLGGSIQEVDVYAGASYSAGPVTVGATYQEWYYAADEERILDLSVAFDDTGLLFEDFALNPAFLVHMRLDGNGGQEEANAYVGSIAPNWQLTEGDYGLSLTVPVSVAYMEDDFQGGDSGLGYIAVGATVSVPLAFIPSDYGDWSAAANTTYYMTEDDAIPGNSEDDFLTVTLSVSVAL